MRLHHRPKSVQCYKDLCKVIPGGTNSPVRSFKGLDISPLIIDRGEGDLIYDIDGYEYIDLCGSWGPLIHGHAHPEIVSVAQKRIAMGMTFGITTEIEEQLASTVTSLVPSIEKIRFVSSGTEATMTAARLARGYTNRPYIVKFSGNYHGHADFFLVEAGSGLFGLNPTSSSAGIPEEIVKYTFNLPYNDIDVCRSFLLDPENRNRIAAVIIEPIAGNMGCVPATQAFLEMLREVTSSIGAVLIFDEVITGFRVALGGVQSLYHVTPDLTCFGKIIGGGFPAAAFGGRAEIMDCLAPLGNVYQAGTLSGNPVAMAAGLKALQLLQSPGFHAELERKTNLITQPIKELIKEKKINACIQQVGSMFTLFFGTTKVENQEDAKKADLEIFKKFFTYMFKNGVYVSPAQHELMFISMAHKESHLLKTRDLIINFF